MHVPSMEPFILGQNRPQILQAQASREQQEWTPPEPKSGRPPNRAQTLRAIEDQLAADKEALENAKRKYEATLSTWQAHPVTVKRQRQEYEAKEKREHKQRAIRTREAIEDQVTALWARFEKCLGVPPDAD